MSIDLQELPPARVFVPDASWGDVSPHQMHTFILMIPRYCELTLYDAAGRRFSSRSPVLVGADTLFNGDLADGAALYINPETAGAPLHEECAGGRGIRVLSGRLGDFISDATWELADGRLDARAVQEFSDSVMDKLTGRQNVTRKFDGRTLEVQRMMASNPTQRPPLNRLAGEIGVSTSHLRHMFKADSGLTLREYSLWLKSLVAAELLLSGLSAAEIAMAAGFSDQAHLTRTFRRIMGTTPAKFSSQERDLLPG